MGEGITDWVAQQGTAVAVSEEAFKDPRFQTFSQLPEDRFEAFLAVPIISRGRLVGALNLQHRLPHVHSAREIQWVSTIGFPVGSELKLARLESEVSKQSEQLETRNILERAKGILQRKMGVEEPQASLTLQT